MAIQKGHLTFQVCWLQKCSNTILSPSFYCFLIELCIRYASQKYILSVRYHFDVTLSIVPIQKGHVFDGK